MAMALPLRRRLRDDELVAQLATGDEHAVRQLHDRFHGALVRYATSLLGWSAQDAEDVVQDAVVDALRAIAGGERPRQLRPWLYRIVRNRAIDEIRRARRRDASLDAAAPESDDQAGAGSQSTIWLAPPSDEPSAVAGRRETLRELVADLAGLPDRQRDALLARVVDGDSPQQSAERLGVSVAAAQMLVVRGRENLQRARDARQAHGDTDRQLRALAPPGGLFAALGFAGFAGISGLGGAKAVPAAVAIVAVAAAAGGFAVVKREHAAAGEAAPFALTGAGTILGHRVVRGETVPDGTAVVASTVRIPAGSDSVDRRAVTLQCPTGMRFAAQISHQSGEVPAVEYTGPPPQEQPRADGRATFRFARTVLTEPARVRIRILCRKPGPGGSLLVHPRLPMPGEGHGTVCAKDTYIYRDPEHLFVGSVFRGQKVTLTRRASRSVFLLTDDGLKGWIKTSDLCPGWTAGTQRG